MSTLKGAVIGCGFFAQNHLKAWDDVQGAELVAVCDLDVAKAEAAAVLTGAQAFSDVDQMFDEMTLDFVDIATTMETHEVLAAKAFARQIAVICQKPFAPDIEATRRILVSATRPLMVHENFRFQAPLIALKQRLDEGVIGTPHFAHISWRTGFDVVAGQPYLAEVERFIILDLGIHVLDIARFLLGDAKDIYCRTQNTMPIAQGEASAIMTLGHQSGAVSEVVCAYTTRIEPDPFPQTLIDIEGSEGSLRLKHDYHLEIHKKGHMERQHVPPTAPAWADPQWALIQQSVFNTQQHWIDCLRAGIEPATSGADNLKTFALVEAAYASAASGQPEVPQA